MKPPEIGTLYRQMVTVCAQKLQAKKREAMTIDFDSTNTNMHGRQPRALFNGYDQRVIDNPIFFHDGQTGKILLGVLRPGNAHTSQWIVGLLQRMVAILRKENPDIKIYFRADAG